MAKYIQHDEQRDGIDRRGFLKCMAWAGTGLVWTATAGGLLTSCALPEVASTPKVEGFTFVQVSDSHVGFSAEGVNTDVTKTLEQVVARINALPQPPALVLHTGDLSHLSKPSEFDTVQQIMGTIKTSGIFYVPGEHDVIGDNGAGFRQRFSAKSRNTDWYSMDFKGVHFIGLSNIGSETEFGVLGTDQLTWLAKDLQSVNHDTPVVVFAHVPLYAVYPPWGWTTKDSTQAMDLLKLFSSVTVLNGHIHQVLSQVEGNIRFHVASSTAFPQHHPGEGQPGAYQLPADELLRTLGYRTVSVVPGNRELAVVDTTLA
ncbi:MAG TPA: metallophosphoesterase [Chloroflexota bacterium]|nr:metallophosphoesterase [Chloroflexota bacterium]